MTGGIPDRCLVCDASRSEVEGMLGCPCDEDPFDDWELDNCLDLQIWRAERLEHPYFGPADQVARPGGGS